VDDHALFREGAARLLNAVPELEVVGSCGSVEEALRVLESTQIDVVLLDVDLRKERGFQFFKPAEEIGFKGRVLIVASLVGLFEARRLIQLGASGIFLKQNSPELLVEAIETIVKGEQYLDPSLGDNLYSDIGTSQCREDLSSREMAVWSGVVEGLTNKEIASRVHISEPLVKITLQQLFDRHGVRTRSQLVRIALEQQPDLG
jgi:DNA-binding NarL/FixJ family response regulator